jgi:hypothetical protein
VSALFTRPAAAMIVEITDVVIHLASRERTLDLPVDRDATRALNQTSADAFRSALQSLGGSGQVICLLPARGVSVRRMALPASTPEEIERLLPLQIDAQFPLSSEELAWGYTALSASVPSREGKPLKEFVVAAVKKESVQQYRQIISSAGFAPVFGIAALARHALCAHPPAKFGLLEVGPSKSELLTSDESGPATLRVLAMGGEGDASAEPLLAALRNNGAVEKIFVGGKGAAIWSARIAPSIPSEPLALSSGQSTAIAGAKEMFRRGQDPLFIHDTREAVRIERAPSHWKWAALAAVLIGISFAIRYAEPIVRRGRVLKAMSELQSIQSKLPKVDRELAFLQFIKTNQPSYVEVVGVLAGSVQPGTTFDGLTINRRGETSIRGKAQNGQAVGSFRTKMIDSGFFSNVVIDEQTPGQNNQNVTFRMTAQLWPEGQRKVPPKPPENKSVTNALTNSVTAPKPTPGGKS